MNIEGIKCGDDCQLYTQMCLMNKLFAVPVMYPPVTMDIFSSRSENINIVTFSDFMNAMFGRHICLLKDMLVAEYDRDVYDKMIISMDIASHEDYYTITKYTAFRSFFNMCLRDRMKGAIKKQIIIIECYQDAVKYDIVSRYFNKDFFHVFSETQIEQDRKNFDNMGQFEIKSGYFQRESEYIDYVKELYPYERVVEMYCNMMKEYSYTCPMWANDYTDPTSFSTYFQGQVAQYMDVIKNIQNKSRLVIYSDGPGTGSYAALLLGREYVSYEPNDIGRIAKQIGLIVEPEKENLDDDVFLYFNCIEYYKDEHIGERKHVVIIDENIRFIPGIRPVKTGGGKVFYKNVDVTPLCLYPLESSRFVVSSMGGKVNPVTYKAIVMCELMGITVDLDARKVTTEVEDEEFNIMTRNDPFTRRAKRNGDYKNIRGENYKVYPGSNTVFTNSGVENIIMNKYSMDRVVTEYLYIDGYYYVRTLRPERVDYITLKDTGDNVRVFLVKRIRHKNIVYGVYRDTRNIMASTMNNDSDLQSSGNVSRTDDDDYDAYKGSKKIIDQYIFV